MHKNRVDKYIVSIRLKHFDVLNTILYTNFVSGNWIQEGTIEPAPYPFSVAVQFVIKIEATDDSHLDVSCCTFYAT